jgi:hypothetical protein
VPGNPLALKTANLTILVPNASVGEVSRFAPQIVIRLSDSLKVAAETFVDSRERERFRELAATPPERTPLGFS